MRANSNISNFQFLDYFGREVDCVQTGYCMDEHCQFSEHFGEEVACVRLECRVEVDDDIL